MGHVDVRALCLRVLLLPDLDLTVADVSYLFSKLVVGFDLALFGSKRSSFGRGRVCYGSLLLLRVKLLLLRIALLLLGVRLLLVLSLRLYGSHTKY